jgi:hypothetical protein
MIDESSVHQVILAPFRHFAQHTNCFLVPLRWKLLYCPEYANSLLVLLVQAYESLNTLQLDFPIVFKLFFFLLLFSPLIFGSFMLNQDHIVRYVAYAVKELLSI